MNFKKIGAFIILFSLIISLKVYTPGTTGASSEIILIPLDSRPCNTDYVLYAAKAVNKNISYPVAHLDDYNKPSNPKNLYKYLYDSLDSADTYIIYTNQILNGGLIASRSPESYLDMEKKLKDFTVFLEKAKELEKKIIVVSVLPRVIPSQFTDLWNFYDELVTFSNSYGSLQIDLSTNLAPQPPKEIINRYLSIYSGSDLIVTEMKEKVEKELIDLLIIGQDDTFKESITNKQINNYLEYNNEKIIVQPGADELTKLILAKLIRQESLMSPLDLKLLYIDPKELKEVKAFESFSTEIRSKQLLDFLSINLNKDSKNLAIIHNKAGMEEKTITEIRNNVNKDYLGLIDIAYINRGDKNLFKDKSFIKNLNGYSGWNTIGNSLGTEYSNLVIYDYLQKNLSNFTAEEQLNMLENYYKLLYVHFADDYLYQGRLREELDSFLLTNEEKNSFISNKAKAEEFLTKIFKEESMELNKALSGSYYNFNTYIHLDFKAGEVSLPWKRSFEIRITPNLKIKKDR